MFSTCSLEPFCSLRCPLLSTGFDFPGGSESKASVFNAGDLGLIPGVREDSPGESNGNPTPVLLPGKSYGQRSLVNYSLRGHKKSDMTVWLHFHSI